MRHVNRIAPVGPVQAYKTYSVTSPVATHWQQVSCKQADCQGHREGWLSLIDEATDLGRKQAHYIRKESGRHFTEMRSEDAALHLKREEIPPHLTAFIFPPGQSCFEPHYEPLERPAIHTVRGGDWRGTVSEPHVMRPQDWIENFGEHQQKLSRAVQRG